MPRDRSDDKGIEKSTDYGERSDNSRWIYDNVNRPVRDTLPTPERPPSDRKEEKDSE